MEGDRTRGFCKRWHQERDVLMGAKSTLTSDLRKCPTLSHDVDFSCSYWKVSSISSLNIPREGLMSSVLNLWPTHHPKHIKYWFKQKNKQNIWITWNFCCFYFWSLSIQSLPIEMLFGGNRDRVPKQPGFYLSCWTNWESMEAVRHNLWPGFPQWGPSDPGAHSHGPNKTQGSPHMVHGYNLHPSLQHYHLGKEVHTQLVII